MKIQNKELTPEDVGKGVCYRGGFSPENGVIKSWTQTFVFVVFKCESNWGRFQEYTANAVDPSDLEWGWR